MTQLELHKKIEEFFKTDIVSADVKVAQELLINIDSKRFFFAQANKSNSDWLDWLWDEGFLDTIKDKAQDATRISYRMPELGYLLDMVEKKSVKVAQIIDSVKISEETFNPEVVDRFFWIVSALPVEQIKTLTKKIRDEKWIYLMRKFNKSGYEFDKIVKKLSSSKENKAILELAQAIFLVRKKEELSDKGIGFSTGNLFYISDLDASSIFEALVDIDDISLEDALKVVTETMTQIVQLSGKDETKIFTYADSYSLFDVNFFTLKLSDKRSRAYSEDIKNLAASIKILARRAIDKNCDDADKVQKMFKYIDDIPSCRSMWRLRLYLLSLCPEVFKEELKIAFFKVFEIGERYFEIEGGEEYHQLLIESFKVLDEKTEQREYIQKVFDYFGESFEEKNKEKWRKRDGLKIIACIKESLTSDEKDKVENILGVSFDKVEYKPDPSSDNMMAGTVNHKSPVNLDDFTVEEIIENLKTIWTLDKLKEKFKDDDFLNPRGVEGLGDALKENMKGRMDEYFVNISSFFDRENIHPHYLYDLLRGIEEMLRNKQSLSLSQVKQLFDLFILIKAEGEKKPFERLDDKSWLAEWTWVHKVIADVLLYILENKENKESVHSTHREDIKNIISYLFTIKDSPSKKEEKPESGELYSVAINSVRGRAYEAFVVFIENDGKELSDDIKEIFNKVLDDNSLAVRFIIGRYLASLYFRDKDFVVKLLPKVFPKDEQDKKDIYLATWEGYLSNTLYDKLFVAFSDYYSHAITLDPKIYTDRKYLKGLDETLAIHFGLAFAHLGLEMTDPLFVQFWEKLNTTRHHEFISFIGRSCLTRDQAGDEWFKENKVSKDKLVKFWDWALQNVLEPKSLTGFGFWVNPGKEILPDAIVVEKIAETLQKSDGDIDWDYGLLRRLPIFAEKNGEKVLEIISAYMIDSNNNLNSHRHMPVMHENEIKDSLEIIYKNGDTQIKQGVVDLIDILIEKGSSSFWGLKEVIEEE